MTSSIHPPMASLELGGGTGTAQVCCRWSSSILGWSYLARYVSPNAPISCINFWFIRSGSCVYMCMLYTYYVHILEWLTTHDHTHTWWDNGHFFKDHIFHCARTIEPSQCAKESTSYEFERPCIAKPRQNNWINCNLASGNLLLLPGLS